MINKVFVYVDNVKSISQSLFLQQRTLSLKVNDIWGVETPLQYFIVRSYQLQVLDITSLSISVLVVLGRRFKVAILAIYRHFPSFPFLNKPSKSNHVFTKNLINLNRFMCQLAWNKKPKYKTTQIRFLRNLAKSALWCCFY